jgi:hypothetical protein
MCRNFSSSVKRIVLSSQQVNEFAPLVYPGGMPRRMELIAGYSVLIWNAFVYAFVVLRRTGG